MQEKDAIGIEINPKYVEIAKKRIDKEIPTLSPLDDWA
jgi:DNA modification methylase